MGIEEEKGKITRQRESLENDLALAEDWAAALFHKISSADISAGIDPGDPQPPLMVERPDPETIRVYCPKCRQDWSDSYGVRRKMLLDACHNVEIRDYPNPQDIINALPLGTPSTRYGCEHGHFNVYAQLDGGHEDKLREQVWRLIRYRAKIRKAIKALDPARAPKDDTIWGEI